MVRVVIVQIIRNLQLNRKSVINQLVVQMNRFSKMELVRNAGITQLFLKINSVAINPIVKPIR